jgi:hypothetical protein
MYTSKHCSLPLLFVCESATEYILMGSNYTNLGQFCRDLFSSLFPLSSYHARISLHAPKYPEPIRVDVAELRYCVGKNGQDVKTINVHN